jgi:protocatechuate 3,4-dioxygenase, alpha subunit
MTTPEPQQPLVPTAGQTIGPFYGFALSYERDHELVPPAAAGAVRLHGTVFDGNGVPVPDALLEIRQADPSGRIPRVEGSIRRDGTVFTGWGRCATDPGGRFSFTTLEPGRTDQGAAPFFAVSVFARGLLNRLFTRAYLPGDEQALAGDRLLGSVSPERRGTLVAGRDDDGSLRFDIWLQGERETVFLAFPRHGR